MELPGIENDYQLQLAGADYPDANDYHCHPPAMQLPCQVVDNDYHLQHYRFHKLAHILHMHNPCHYLCSFCISAMQTNHWITSPMCDLTMGGEEPRKSNVAPHNNILHRNITSYPR